MLSIFKHVKSFEHTLLSTGSHETKTKTKRVLGQFGFCCHKNQYIQKSIIFWCPEPWPIPPCLEQLQVAMVCWGGAASLSSSGPGNLSSSGSSKGKLQQRKQKRMYLSHSLCCPHLVSAQPHWLQGPKLHQHHVHLFWQIHDNPFILSLGTWPAFIDLEFKETLRKLLGWPRSRFVPVMMVMACCCLAVQWDYLNDIMDIAFINIATLLCLLAMLSYPALVVRTHDESWMYHLLLCAPWLHGWNEDQYCSVFAQLMMLAMMCECWSIMVCRFSRTQNIHEKF